METQREVGLDIIRSTAIFSVVFIHLFLNTDFYLRVYSGFDLGIQVFFHSLFMVCVPLFMMLTGYLLKNKVMSQDFYKKGISICCFYLIYVCLVLLYKVIAYKETFSIRDIFDSILSFSGRNYFWYIKFYLILYMFIPLLNWLYRKLISQASKILLIAIPVLLSSFPAFLTEISSGRLSYPRWMTVLYPAAYYFIGCYISEYRPSVKKRLVLSLFLLSVLLESVMKIYLYFGKEQLPASDEFGSLLILAESVFLFLMLYDVHLRNTKVKRMTLIISQLSFDIYLVSYITDSIVYETYYTYFTVPRQGTILLLLPLASASLVLAMLFAALRKKLIHIR